MQKRGRMRAQVSVIIVFGLIVLVMTAIGLTYVGRGPNNPVDRYVIKDSIGPFADYVEECLEKSSLSHIYLIAERGGTFLPQSTRWYMGNEHTYLCAHVPGSGCVSTLPLRQDMEAELEEAILDNLKACIDLSIFERQGYTVEAEFMRLDVAVGREKVELMLNYPVVLRREEVVYSRQSYLRDVPLPLGMLFELALEIVNAEAHEGFFDQVSYMADNGLQVMVEKHRPYPDIVYTLAKDGLLFRFGLEGAEAAPGEPLEQQGLGCCYNLYDRNCYKNVPMEACVEIGGVYDSNTQCICPSTQDTGDVSCQGRQCRDCPGHSHGESWCTFDAKAGRGYDYVGTRHYRSYCIDGEVYTEECRDFREELCTQSGGMAECRPNRWEDCALCDTEECCLDTRYRDCDWKEWLNTENKCVPYVPQGFRFWEWQGSEICARATQTRECDGFSCPNIWVDDTAMFCYMQGDCGSYRNVADRVTLGGFFNSDIFDTVRDYVYLEDGLKGEPFDLGFSRERQPLYSSPVGDAASNYIRLLSAAMNYIRRASRLSVSDFLSPEPPDFSVIDIAVCDVWQAPSGGEDCSLCGPACTEYRCHSLGAQCAYEEEEGVPYCRHEGATDTTGPTITVSAPGRSVRKVSWSAAQKTYFGYNITPEIEPYSLFRLSVSSDEESVCRLNYLPRQRFFRSPSYYLGGSGYSVQHNITLRMPERITIPGRIRDFFGLNLTDLAGRADEPRKLMETYQEEYADEIDQFREATGRDIAAMIAPYVDRAVEFMGLISDTIPYYKDLFRRIAATFEKGSYIFFVECHDRAGNRNAEEVFVTFSIADSLYDMQAPRILAVEPKNTSKVAKSPVPVTLYLSEPSECRYDMEDLAFADMKKPFECGTELSPKYHGAYTCTGEVPADSVVYIRCADSPARGFTYRIRPEVTENSTGTHVFVRGSYARALDYLPVPSHVFTIHVLTDENMQCTLLQNNLTRALPCRPTGNRTSPYDCQGPVLLEKQRRQMELVIAPGQQNSGVLSLDIWSGEKTVSGNYSFLRLNAQNCTIDSSPMNCSSVCEAQVLGTHTIDCILDPEIVIDCRELQERAQNTHQQSRTYYVESAPPLEIVRSGPANETGRTPALFVQTSRPSSCGYYTDDFAGKYRMQSRGNTSSASLKLEPGYYQYMVFCEDEFSMAEAEIAFSVV